MDLELLKEHIRSNRLSEEEKEIVLKYLPESEPKITIIKVDELPGV